MTEIQAATSVRRELVESVAVLTIDNPPVNALSAAVLEGLDAELAWALGEPSVRGIVLAGARDSFVAGADVARLEKIAAGAPLDDPRARVPRLPDLVARLERSEKPTVAAIDGVALGGGLELALGCHARVGTARCRVGLPELKLGLIPGAGGTQRLPRVAGVAAALDLMLTSRQAKGPEALELGILDALAPEPELVQRAVGRALDLASGRLSQRRTLERDDRLGSDDAAAIEAARAVARRRYRAVTFAQACIDAVAEGLTHGPHAGLEKERELFAAALRSEGARGLIHLFFAERAASKVPGVTDRDLVPRVLAHITVVGGGTMGSGIATALLDAGLRVRLVESATEAAAAARSRVEESLARSVEKGRLSQEQAAGRLAQLTTQTGLDGVEQSELVIEAASEDIALKQRLFSELGTRTSEQTWLCTNTSTIDVSVLAQASGHRERVLGMHFFSPAHVMPLVEIVRTDDTSDQALVDALSLCRRLKKTPVTVRSCPGFLVNRVFMPYSQLTGFLIDRGVDPYRIDRAMFAFGMPMGPCRMSDLAGVDVGVAAGSILDAAYPDRAYRSPLRQLLVEAGRLGEKAGRGHYRYDGGKASEDPELSRFVAEARARVGSPAPIELDDEGIVAMLIFGIVNEACRAIEEGVVARPSDVDVAAVLGMGFPAHRGGPLKWADGVGARHVQATLARWSERFGHGIFAPSARLAERARSGSSLLA